MILTIYFDGKEAVVKDPSENLIRLVTTALNGTIPSNMQSSAHRFNISPSTNCKSVQVFPSRHTGNTTDLWIKVAAISAVRFASPTSSESK